ncbi:MAG: GNAT family N-acetyltransferase [Sedimenticola sp.]|nr:GNAT family N-acetyltransferase [Sedimenticola sp.]
MSNKHFSVTYADWEQNKTVLRAVRESVFIIEQNVPKDLEWDDRDKGSLHVVATDVNGKTIGTGRLTDTGQIGRMAVLNEWRNCGVGSALLEKLIELADQHKIHPLYLNAQKKAIPFYQRHGFECTGDEFIEAGIPHQRMEQQH